MQKYFTISQQREMEDILSLSAKIENSGFVDENTIIVNCSPEYSSIACQILSHTLSPANGNKPLDMEFLQMPYPTASEEELSQYRRDVVNLAVSHFATKKKLLLIDSGVLRGSNFQTAYDILLGYLGKSRISFCCLYLQSDSIFTPNHHVTTFDFEADGGLLFWWENPNNPHWPW